MLVVTNLIVHVDGKQLLRNITFSARPGRIHCIIGESGAGKTTLLKSIAGLVPIESGDIRINGKQLHALSASERAEQVGYVFQQFNLFPHLTVLQNCIDPLLVHNKPYDVARQRALEMLKALEIDSLAARYSNQLSGGQQQRVAIARALCLNPSVILLDEPTASLDPANTARLANILRSLAEQGLTIVISSQDMRFVQTVFDAVCYMQDGALVEMCDDRNKLKDTTLLSRWLSV